MIQEAVEDAEDITAGDLQQRYERAVAARIEAVGVEHAVDETGVEAERLETLLAADGTAVELTVEEAAAALAMDDDAPDAEALLLEVRDQIMLGMSSAVLDVDALARELDGELTAREIQQKIEGRQPMTLAEYARINHLISARNPY